MKKDTLPEQIFLNRFFDNTVKIKHYSKRVKTQAFLSHTPL